MIIFHPFRPHLQGIFLTRFHTVVSELFSEARDPRDVIDELAHREYFWATSEVTVNPRQRRVYRAVWLLLRDLLRARWTCRLQDGVLEVAPPPDPEKGQVTDPGEAKALKGVLRNVMAEVRREKIAEAREFIEWMESPPAGAKAKMPIDALIADGECLSRELGELAKLPIGERLSLLKGAVKPYLQLVRDNERCSHTGHKLSDIWRYFRFTWATPAETTPGRTLLYLIRDGARPNHPVMGLASLENAPIMISDRDHFLGWTFDSFEQEVNALDGDVAAVHHSFSRLLKNIALAIGDINLEGLCKPSECERPTDALIQRLAGVATKSAAEREQALKAWQSRDGDDDEDTQERSELGNISLAAEEALYRRKRADHLGRLLTARKALLAIMGDNFEERFAPFLKSEKGQAAIRTALRATKNRHIGTSLLELNVCGAIPPYNEILGGKLVALAVLSPEVLADYKERYGARPSDIASRLKGETVIRPADLVFLGTTSLYWVGSSQYNRIKLPAGFMRPEAEEVRWRKIGATKGHGTLHISRLTIQCLESVINADGFAQVNNVFGEGASPKLRIVRQALEELFEPGQRAAIEEMTRHAMGRLVYGVWLASDGAAYLRGDVDQPTYYFDPSQDPEEGTEKIVDYWRERWLAMRLDNKPSLDRMAQFDPRTLLVSQFLRSGDELGFDAIEEGQAMEEGKAKPNEALREFVRELYRGYAAYSDRIPPEILKKIHVPTNLDTAILESLRQGKSVILTGNPGDGKTHIMRVLAPKLGELDPQPVVELDASKVHDEKLKEDWESALADGRPYCVAINEAVLFNLADLFPDFKPLQEARWQAANAIRYDDKEQPEHSVVVFDLSRRNVLSPEIVKSVLDKFCADKAVPTCASCPGEGCDFVTNRQLLHSQQVRERIQLLLDRVSRRGYHATLRELQALASYLLFGGRSCERLISTSGDPDFALSNLLYRGEGGLFTNLHATFDPAQVSHPVWDDDLVFAETKREDWLEDWQLETDALEPSNRDRFEARKRAFFLFHSRGDELLALADDDESKFAKFLRLSERDALRHIVKGINRFFGSPGDTDGLRVWQSHRFNQSSRQTLISAIERGRSEFEVVHPRLLPSMAAGFDLAEDHVLFRLKDKHQAKLKIDFELFRLLAEAERGIPVLAIEGDASRRIWQFMERLAEPLDRDEQSITIYDTLTEQRLVISVDVEADRYLSIKK